jgi:hypothetical protein
MGHAVVVRGRCVFIESVEELMKLPVVLCMILLAVAASPAAAQKFDPTTLPKKDIDGSPMYIVLPRDEIPAVFEPEFLHGEEADAQMEPHEPILGVFDGVNARAYSLWQLDHHEVVDDMLGNVPIAATW